MRLSKHTTMSPRSMFSINESTTLKLTKKTDLEMAICLQTPNRLKACNRLPFKMLFFSFDTSKIWIKDEIKFLR